MANLRYPYTLQLISCLPQRRPALSLPGCLNTLFDHLSVCTDAVEAGTVEDAIWDVWMHDDHEGAGLALQRACDDIVARRYDIAETRLVLLLRRRPDWAEAWNKAATLYYVLERDDESVAAIRRTLEIEPRHFGAMCGLGEILRVRGEIEAACLVFSRALRIHPLMHGVRQTLGEMQRQ